MADDLCRCGIVAKRLGIDIVDNRYIFSKDDFDRVRSYRTKNIIENKFGEWVVLAYDIIRSSERKPSGSFVGSHFLCRCSCGKTASLDAASLKSGRSTRCSSCALRASKQTDKSGVYIIKAKGLKIYKVGVSRNIQKRVQGLNTQSPIPLYLRYIKHFTKRSDANRIEKLTHLMLDKYHSHGEWFNLSDSQIIYLMSVLESLKI